MMKRVLAIVAALALTGTMAYSQVTQVVSRNAVGYVKLTVTNNNNFLMGTVPFNDVGDTTPRTITEIFGNQLTGTDLLIAGSDFVLVWSASDQAYNTFWKANNAGNPEWRDTINLFNSATNTLAPGDAFFVQNNQSSVQCVFVMGEVPDSFTVTDDTTTVFAVEGFNQIAYSYPVDIAMTNLNLIPEPAAQGFAGDQLLRWNPDILGYKSYFYDTVFAGSPSWKDFNNFTVPNTEVIPAGEGFFYNRLTASTLTWEESKPYTWP
jgi:hypothetical protein